MKKYCIYLLALSIIFASTPIGTNIYTYAASSIIYGDFDNDGDVDADDIVSMRQAIVGIIVPSARAVEACDLNSNGEIDIGDVVTVRQAVNNGTTDELYPIGCYSPTPPPSATPTTSPTAKPTASPTSAVFTMSPKYISPTAKPTASPTAKPTATPTATPNNTITLTQVSTTITAPTSGNSVSYKATAPLAANYTLGNISWSPSVSSKYAAYTVYTATIVATANNGYIFSTYAAAYVNGNSATSVKVSSDKKTLTFTYKFPQTSSPTATPTATPTASPTAKPTATPTTTPKPTATPYTSDDDESDNDEITLDMNCSFNDTYGYAAVTITASDKNAKIYYSTDDEDPDESSSLYTGPLYFYDETTICAVAINGNTSSDVYYMDVTFYEDESDEDDEDSEYEDEEEYDEEYEESEDEEYSDDYDYADDEYSGDMIYSDWAEEELLVAIEDGLIPDEMLDENLTTAISREKFAAIAVTLYESLSGSSAPNIDIEDTPFEDCYLSESEYVGYIGSAYALGIVNGVSSNEFAPYMAISREELATMLCRVVKKRTISGWSISNDRELDTSGASKFADDSYISDFAKNSVYFMAKNGVIKGIDDTHFAPRNVTEYERNIGYATATKEQAILMSKRCYENFDDFDITYR